MIDAQKLIDAARNIECPAGCGSAKVCVCVLAADLSGTLAASIAREAKLREALDALVNADRLYGDMLPTRLWDAARAALADTEVRP